MTPAERISTVGVVVVDDQVLFREVAREVVAATPGFELLGEAASGEHALAVVEDVAPDLVLLDVRMPGMDGTQTAARLTELHSEILVVLISVEDASGLPGDLHSCGAAELLRKQDFGRSALRDVWKRHRAPAGDAGLS